MNILTKIIAPIIVVFGIYGALIHFYWAPKLYEQAKTDFKYHTEMALSAMEDSVLIKLLANDYSALYTILDKNQTKNINVWLNLTLYDEANEQIYPLFVEPIDIDGKAFIFPVEHQLQLDGELKGKMTLDLNWQPTFEVAKTRVQELENFLFMTIFCLLILLLFIQIKFIKQPLSLLNRFAQYMSKGDYSQKIPISSNDEFGKLSQTFNNMQEAIVASEFEVRQQQDALDQHAIVSITNVEGIIEFVNDNFCLASGYKLDDLIGANHRIVNSQYHDKSFFSDLYQTITNNQVWQGEIRNKNKAGEYYWVITTVVPFKGADGKVNRYVAISSDITKQKLTEEGLTRAKEVAEKASQSKSEFLANMSHEIRTPMNGVIGLLDLLADSTLKPEQQKWTKLAKSSANTLLTLINDILDFSKIEKNQLTLESHEFNLIEMLDDFIQAMAMQVNSSKVSLILDTSGINTEFITTDPVRVRQIFTNLVGNAIKFTSQGHVLVEVSTNKSDIDGEIELIGKIIDTGIGIAEKNIQNLFKAFTQEDASTTRQYGGTGLGLTITKLLVELMGGEISVTSEKGKGSCFTFSLQVKGKIIKAKEKKLGQLILVSADNVESQYAQRLIEKVGFQVDVIHDIERLPLTLENHTCYDWLLVEQKLWSHVKNIIGRESSQTELKIGVISNISVIDSVNKKEYQQVDVIFTKPLLISDLRAELINEEHKQTPIALEKEDNKDLLLEAKKSVLLVDDNKVNQMVAVGVLKKLGLTVDVANDGKEAIDKLSKSDYAIVFMDCQMPIMDGYEASSLIRSGAAGETKTSVPIIALTANAMAGDKEKCLQFGMSDYLPKPLQPKMLIEKLKQYL